MNLQEKSAELVNVQNLDRDYYRTREIGDNRNKSITRLAYSTEENKAHDYFKEQMESMGLDVYVDHMGNLYGILPGENERLILSGSHLDTVKTGGNADGAAGCIAALEAVSCIKQLETKLPYSVGCCVFRGEESDRFGQSLIGSRGLFGTISHLDLLSEDDSGISIYDAMEQNEFYPHNLRYPTTSKEWNPNNMIRNFIELHPEQSFVLEQKQKQIGIVQAIAAPERYIFKITGRRDHSGATPMTGRRDANQGMVEMVSLVEKIANDNPPTVMTVGECGDVGGSINTISGQAYFKLDCRDVDTDRRTKIRDRTIKEIHEIAERRGLKVHQDYIGGSDPVTLDQEVAKSIEISCQNLGVDYMRMNSGASHDAATFAKQGIPTGTIFIPSIEGISHSGDEAIEKEDLVIGTQVLVTTMLGLALEK